MKEIFNDYSDVLSYLEKSGIDRESKNINLNKCNFCFKLDLDMLFFSLNNKYNNYSYLTFEDSDFQYPVSLFLVNQEPIKDELGELTSYKYLKTKIKFTLDFRGCHFFDTVEFSGIEFCKDLDFINAVFNKDVTFSELVFKSYLRLFEATFCGSATFAYLELNDKSIFFTNIHDRTKFDGDLIFFDVVFSEAKFWNFIFIKDVLFQNTVFNCPALFNKAKFQGKIVFSSIETIGLTEFNNKVYFDNAEISNLSLINIVIDKVFSFNYATIKNISIENVHCIGFPLSLVGTKFGKIKDEGTARFLKSEALKSNDPFLFAELNTIEMNLHYKKLRWCRKKDIFDKTILFLNKYSTNFGDRWQQGVAFILLSWTLSFSFIVMLRDGIGETFIWFNKSYLKESIAFIWQFGSIEILGHSTGILEIVLFVLGKILIIYGVYQTIAAFRKYGSK